MKDVKGIILDVDGVIVGEKIGYNSPWPNEEVMNKLKEIKNSGIPISLCSGKPYFSIDKIIKDANLNNYHIADGGSIIINPITNSIIKEYNVPKEQAKKILQLCIDNNIYVEFYTVDNYYIESSQECDITKIHAHILQRDAIKLDDIVRDSEMYNITKVMPIARDEEDMKHVQSLIDELNTGLSFNWGVHPIANPLKFLMVTAPGISKKEGALEIAKSMGVESENILAVGDSTSDWKFISICGFGGAMGNASDELKKLVKSKENNKYFIGKDVDNNGILDILDYFLGGHNE